MYSQQKQELYKYLKSLGRISEQDYEYFLRDETGTFIPAEKTAEEVKKEWLQTYNNAMAKTSLQWENAKEIPGPVLIYNVQVKPEDLDWEQVVQIFKEDKIVLWDSSNIVIDEIEAGKPNVVFFTTPGTSGDYTILDTTTEEGKQKLKDIIG